MVSALSEIVVRTHQLRVHMSHVGHPMLGDTIYSPRNVIVAAPRLCLHARSISLKHPVTGLPMIVDSLPNTIEAARNQQDIGDGASSCELGKRKVDKIVSVV